MRRQHKTFLLFKKSVSYRLISADIVTVLNKFSASNNFGEVVIDFWFDVSSTLVFVSVAAAAGHEIWGVSIYCNAAPVLQIA